MWVGMAGINNMDNNTGILGHVASPWENNYFKFTPIATMMEAA
jgi:hypothetical protein